MESRDEDGLSKHMSVHRVHNRGSRGCRFLRGALRNIELRIERVELERVVMVRTGRCAGTHVRIRAQADLTAAIRQLALRNALGQTG